MAAHPRADAVRAAVTLEQCWHRVPGGTATSILRTVDALVARGDVDVVGVAARHRHPPPDAFRTAVPVRQLPLPRRALYETWHAVRRPRVERATGVVDVVHATTAAIPGTSAPLVATVHDLAFLHAPEHFTRHGVRFFRRGLELTRRHARLVLVPSQQTLDDCLYAGLPAARLRVVPWGVTAAAPVPDAEADAVLDRLGVQQPYLLWCGTHEPRKNLPGLLAAFGRIARRHPDTDLVLVGPRGWGAATAPDELTDGALRRRVRALGFVPEGDLQALYSRASAFAYPSLREGFGMPVLEALAHGVPVVTSVATPMAELVGPAGLTVVPTDAGGLADALDAALGVDHDRLASTARAQAARYPWAATAAATARAYHDAAS